MQKVLHPTDDIDRIYVSRKGGRRLASIEDSVDASIRVIEDYTKKEQRKTNCSDQKQQRQHNNQQNNNN